MYTYVTDQLVELVRQRETIPDSGTAYDDETLVRYLDQSLKGFIIPAIVETIEEHFVVTRDFEIAAFPVPAPGQQPPTDIPNWFEIPTVATGYRLRDVYIVGTDGGFYGVPRLTPTQAGARFGAFSYINANTSFSGYATPVGGFYLQGNTVQIFPYGLASGNRFRVTFERRPGDLILSTGAGQVINVTGDTLTLDKVVTAWQAPNPVPRVGLVSNFEPHDFLNDPTTPTTVYASPAKLDDVQLASVAANVVVLPPGMGAAVSVGDWVCPLNASVFPQNIPREMMPALIQKAAEMCIHAAGDAEGAKVANVEFQNLMAAARKMIAPRVIGKPTKTVNSNTPFMASRSTSLGRW